MSKSISISYSKVVTFKACPQKYYLAEEYPEDISSSALPFGKAVESGVDVLIEKGTLEKAKEVFLAYWKESPPSKWGPAKTVFDSEDVFYYSSDFDKNLIGLPQETLIEDWKKELGIVGDWEELIGKFHGQVSNNAYIDPKQRKFAHRVHWLCCKLRGEIMLEAFQEQLLPEITQVVSNQKVIQIANDEGDKVRGYIDYILKLKGYSEPIVVDLKTAGKFYTNHDLDTSDQLGIYAAAEKIGYIAYMVILKNIKHEKHCDKCNHLRENSRKSNCEKCEGGKYTKIVSSAATQILVRKLRDNEHADVIADFSDVATSIKNGVNWKNPASCFNFNKRCAYYDFCYGTKSLDDLPGIRKK